jgi:hypothetical protein
VVTARVLSVTYTAREFAIRGLFPLQEPHLYAIGLRHIAPGEVQPQTQISSFWVQPLRGFQLHLWATIADQR